MPRLHRAGVDPFRLISELAGDAAADVDLHVRWYRLILREMIDARLAAPTSGAASPTHGGAWLPAEARGAERRPAGAKRWIVEDVLAPVQAAWQGCGIADTVGTWVTDPPQDLVRGVAGLLAEGRSRRDSAGLPALLRDRERLLRERALAGQEFAGAYVPFDVFRRYETFSLVVEGIADLAGKRRIDMVRISPRDADNLRLIGARGAGDVRVRSKLAGEILGHFGGLLDEGWRRNGYVWGRLDAAEILLAAIAASDPKMPRGRLAALVEEARRQILVDEHRLLAEERGRHKPAPGYDPLADPEANLALIGLGHQTLADLPLSRRARLIAELVRAIPRMLQAPVAGSGHAWAGCGVQVLGRVLGALAEPLARFMALAGALAGRGRERLVLAAGLAAGLALGAASRPALERLWAWLIAG